MFLILLFCLTIIETQYTVDYDGDKINSDLDCNDNNTLVYPGAKEKCDGYDNDCNGIVDEHCSDKGENNMDTSRSDTISIQTSTTTQSWEKDSDNDGILDIDDNCIMEPNEDQKNSDGDLSGDVCDPDDDNDGAPDSIDCSPDDPTVYPGAAEICNGVDNDCDGKTDNNLNSIIDLYEPNETCSSPEDISNVELGKDALIYKANIYPEGDKDYFRFYFLDVLPSCSRPLEQPVYSLILIIEPPVFEDLDIYLYDDSCNLLSKSVRSSFSMEKLVYKWKGNCWKLDSQYFRVLIKDKSDYYRCNNYSLTIKIAIE